MAAPIQIWLVDGAGVPKTDAVQTIVKYVEKTGVDRPIEPTLENAGGGQYIFVPSEADEAVGTSYVIDNGVGAVPRFSYGSVSTKANRFVTACVFDDATTLGSGAPTLGSYLDADGDPIVLEPAVVQVGAIPYLYTVTPSAADLAVGVSMRIDSAVGKLPGTLNAAFPPLPSVLDIDPSSGNIAPDDEVTIDVNTLEELQISAASPGGADETVYKLGALAANYLAGSSIEPIAGGHRLHLVRTGGWPAGGLALNVQW